MSFLISQQQCQSTKGEGMDNKCHHSVLLNSMLT